MASETWAPTGVAARFNLAPTRPSAAHTELNAVSTPAEGAETDAQPWNPANPLFWFGALAALTFGLMAVSTTVRVGPAKASLSLGEK
jgi:hypothetical protein